MEQTSNKNNEAKLFMPGKTKQDGESYHYGFFYQECDSKYYITEDIIEDIISDIDWELNEYEKGFLEKWKSFEEKHRKYCLGEITKKKYDDKIEHNYNEYYNEYGIEFGEGCDELINFLLRHLIG
jgi:hypothetical protein